MDVRLVLCLLWALLATASARPSSCYHSIPGESNAVRSCSSGADSCIAVQEANSFGGVVNTGVLQLCTNSLISLEGDLDFEFGGGVYVRVHSEICRETNCNTGEIKERPKISTVPNGRQCPSCFAPGSHRCLHNVTLHCQGAANQCVDVVGTLSENYVEIPFAARGCATQDVAKIKAGDILVSGVFTYRIKSIQLSPAPRTEIEDGF
ncbi:phospholipase A2 inhibitor and Ly6/PLAUR domain-containing protein-like [Mauremys mutica]|uniref:phospholipase A2 inhibitor and Ly6/PLAUR domain-containing protein-like n=1 Tax=Mauremys mutica TaxID=74926 RepID=UPI001D165DE4|nr:phospholipase A2 inhibitor and Ly6/PLAUR domain-containing protein-like [Mauremys mutica]XP_044847052.1 phospholipase A2 inhibitor and Ly6/PLAUR domain-containing protein-like [Mauremys mutica]XP_044847820.1 phospholipase A2 inhibitor and Ly6/PLAUR domain-containing protein-like [Mauremys mutica]XP_044847821.1 phospholipase A2 inhibitor and Ly6/PLAUR domain-containing protein-like [Mauremys mutica]